MTYEINDIPAEFLENNRALPRKQAKNRCDWLVEHADSRRRHFVSFVKSSTNGSLILDYSPESLVALGNWLSENLKCRKRSTDEINAIIENIPQWVLKGGGDFEYVLDDRSISIMYDLAFYFSHVAMSLDSSVSWHFYSTASKADINKNQLVLKGGRLSNLDMNPFRVMHVICMKIAEGGDPGRLKEVFDYWME